MNARVRKDTTARFSSGAPRTALKVVKEANASLACQFQVAKFSDLKIE